MKRDPFAKGVREEEKQPVAPVKDVSEQVDELVNNHVTEEEEELPELYPVDDEQPKQVKEVKKIRFRRHPDKVVRDELPDIYGKAVKPEVKPAPKVEEVKAESSVLEKKQPRPVDKPVKDKSANRTMVQYTPPKIGINWNRALLLLVALSIIGIIFFSQMVTAISPALLILLWLFGMMCFLPLGVIMGWLFLDQYMRCKIMRRFRHKNYGIINFLHPGGKRITSKIKNLDDDVIIDGTRMWLLRGEGVYYQDKDTGYVKHASISAENVVTLPSNVPELFLDTSTMLPLTFGKTMSQSNPQQAGAVISGHIQNQIAKNLFFKRNIQLFFVITLALTGITFVLVLTMYQDFEELSSTITALRSQVTRLVDLVSELNPPTGV